MSMVNHVVDKIMGTDEAWHKAHPVKDCTCKDCRMYKDKHSRGRYVDIAGTVVSTDRP